MKTKPIYDITPFTVLDYPDHLAAILWFAKCQMRCAYCYNRDIVLGEGKIDEEEALRFLEKRQSLLEGVVLSGGEATLYNRLIPLCENIKNLGYKIKLDTNGLKPSIVQELIEKKLIDYVALDYKAPKETFPSITGNKSFDLFSATLNFLIKTNFPFEVRTTVHNDLLNVGEINKIIDDLVLRGYDGTYYLQRFFYTDTHLGTVHEEDNTFTKEHISTALDVVWRE